MVVRYLGHSCFYVSSTKGTAIIIDPYGTSLPYNFPDLSADIVVMSHEHNDHNAGWRVQGTPIVIKRTSDFIVEFETPVQRTGEMVTFKGIPTHHDKFSGRRKGPNTIYLWFMEGLKLCHLGDLGHMLTDQQLKMVGDIDVLFCPVGGGTVLDPTEAVLVINQINPKIVFPMHYKTPEAEFMSLVKEPIEAFTSRFEKVEFLHAVATNVELGRLPASTKVMVLDHG
ncbi:MAG: MBL fold metallo-hydrolase [Candidatus Eremiobacteraeota bacterium]|nr:MBL fold metallo-hydrolase [Candidatus Eremiobacteraeota bacterium]